MLSLMEMVYSQDAGAIDVETVSNSWWNAPADPTTTGVPPTSYTDPNFGFGSNTSGYPGVAPSYIENSGVSDAGTFVLAETSLDMHCWGENPVVTAKLQLNGQDRFSEREGTYFDLVQPYQFHTRAPDTGINVYSFALRPEEHQPSGTCNFSRIDNATLQLVLSNATVEGHIDCESSCLRDQLQRSPYHEWYGWTCLFKLSFSKKTIFYY